MNRILKFITTSCLAVTTSTIALETHAQVTDKNIMVVFDASGSMWGQINGRTKIEIARDTLSSVLSEVTQNMNLGMIAYGHRRKGQCSDIETVVRPGPAASSVPAMISMANAIKPKGKTPLSDAVRIAAEELRYTENEATVILVTDGIETCDANPCALATELENSGINFTTHVVGFGLSHDEGRQVACLAENTGGQYFPADDADGLNRALKQTFAALPNEDDFEDAVTTRNVQLTVRDTPQSERLTIRKLRILPASQSEEKWPDDFKLFYEGADFSASGTFEPGEYEITVQRSGDSGSVGYTATTSFRVEEGEGIQSIDLSLASRLNIVTYLSQGEPYDSKNPPPGGVKRNAYLYVAAFQIIDGKISEKPAFTGHGNTENAVTPGTYLIRGEIDRTTSREKLVEVKAGETTTFNFDMGVSKVYLNALEDGQPVKRQTTYFYDKIPSGRNYWRSGHGGKGKNGRNNPFYLAPGTWVVNVGNEGGGKRRSEIIITVPRSGEEIRMDVAESTQYLPEEAAIIESNSYKGCYEYAGVKYNACLVEKVDLATLAKPIRKASLETDSNSDAAQDNSDFEEVNQTPAKVAALTLPLNDSFSDFNGIFAAVGFEQDISGNALANLCSSKPIVVTKTGILAYKRLENNDFVTEEVRHCSKHDSGEIDCSPTPISSDGERINIAKLDKSIPLISLRDFNPNNGIAESCLAGPDGRNGPRLCTYIKQCDRQALEGVSLEAMQTLFDTPSKSGE